MTKKKELTLYDLPGVGAATAEKLQEAGYDTIMSVAVATPGELCEAAGFSEASARKLINFARNNMDMGFTSGDELLVRREGIIKLGTGSNSLNALVGGGFEVGSITECYGAFGCGKTSLAHQLAVITQLPRDQGGKKALLSGLILRLRSGLKELSRLRWHLALILK